MEVAREGRLASRRLAALPGSRVRSASRRLRTTGPAPFSVRSPVTTVSCRNRSKPEVKARAVQSPDESKGAKKGSKKSAAKAFNLLPVYEKTFADHLNPILAYRCITKEDSREAPSFLFESVE